MLGPTARGHVARSTHGTSSSGDRFSSNPPIAERIDSTDMVTVPEVHQEPAQGSGSSGSSEAGRTYQVVIIGSGFGGQIAAMSLLKRGNKDFCILERRDFMGGTWCQNTYPGAAVDVPSPLYSIARERFAWSQMFADQAELERYTNGVIDKYNLRGFTRTRTNVERLEWVGDRWIITITDGAPIEARFVINATGPLSTPVVPDVPGRDTFGGDSFHTNNWDHTVDYRNKRVAVVGSGASAAQVIPAIQPDVSELHVFQRTPHWVMPRHDHTFTPWQRFALRSSIAQRALRTWIYWSLESRVIAFKYSHGIMKRMAQAPALQHLEAQIEDPDLRSDLTPEYTIGCKRIILSSTLYPALAADNTTLHTAADGIDHIDESGIVTESGRHLDVDVIVWSTGYDATDGMITYPVVGRDGHKLAEEWSEFPRAYLGTSIPYFPNLFIVTGPNTGIGHTSALFVIEAQMEYIMRALDHVRYNNATAIEVSPDAERAYTDMIHREMEQTVWKSGGCNSWYQSKSGHVIAMFPGFSFSFRLMARFFRASHHHLS